MDINSLLDQPHKLPTIPKVTQQLILSFRDEEIAFDEVATQLSADPVLSAKLLRLANSAYFHLSRTIGTVDHALRMLGFVMVRNLVLGNSMAAAFRTTPGIDLNQFWQYNLNATCASRWLAQVSDVKADLVFTVALMHGVGQLQMHVGAPQLMGSLDKKMHILDARRAALEQQELGFHHGDVAAELARIWNFPESIVAALRDVPDPLLAREFSPMAACVHLGSWRARSEVFRLNENDIVASCPVNVCERLKLGLTQTTANIPAFKELTDGLEAMLL